MPLNLKSIIERAVRINRTLGIKSAAGYCRNQNMPLPLAVSLLARRPGYRRPAPV